MMVLTWVVLLPVLLIFVSLIILAIIKGGVVGKVVLAIFLSLLGFVFLGFFTMKVSDRVVAPSTRVTVVRSDTVAVGIAWRDGVEDELKADVYSSKKAAIRGLGRELDIFITTIAKKQADPLAIRIVQGGVEDHLLGELKEVMSGKMTGTVTIGGSGEADISISLMYADTQVNTVWKNEIQNGNAIHMRQAVGAPMQSGLITATVETAEGKEIESVKYSQKKWLTNIQEFSQSTPGDHWAVARSDDACLSEEQAVSQAMAKARGMVAGYGRQRQYISEQDLINLGFVSDRFTQSFYGSAGRIWRAAVLLDVSPERTWTLSRRVMVTKQIYRSDLLNQILSLGGVILSLGGVILLICVVYWFVNAATKGYYSWRLRVLAILVLLILLGVWFAGSVVSHWYAAVNSMGGMN